MTETLNYTPPASVAPFLVDESFISLIVGPVGSTKTTAAIMKIAYHAAQMAPCRDGIRRSKAVWVRNTREQLKDTSIPDFLGWFPDGVAGTLVKTSLNYILRFGDVECEILFRGLDDANDVRRLLSLQTSFGILDEFREINKQVFEALQGRVGRYPSKRDNGVGCVCDDGRPNKHIWGASNPPDLENFWETLLSDPPKNVSPHFQPSGLSPEADWTEFLPDDYYANLAEGKSQDWIDVYIHAKFGKTLAGRPVYTTFQPAFHVAKTRLMPIRMTDRPLIIGMDFGLNPSATINQLDPRGRFLTFDAISSDGMGVQRFLATKLKPLLAQKHPGFATLVVGDPAGSQRAQTDERTCFEMIVAAGFKVIPARTNSVVARIGAVETFLGRQIDGGPGRLLCPEGAKPLITGYRGGYRYKLKKSGDAEDHPEKNSHSHICFAAGTQIATPTGETAIESLLPGDMVLTPEGPRPVVRAWMSSARAQVVNARLANGRTLCATPNHPVWVDDVGYRRIDELQYAPLIYVSTAWIRPPASSSTERCFTKTQKGTGRPYIQALVDHVISTAKSGWSTTAAPFRRAVTFTTRTMIAATGRLKIWNVWGQSYMPNITHATAQVRPQSSNFENGSERHAKLHAYGTSRTQAERGTEHTGQPRGLQWLAQRGRRYASAAIAIRTTTEKRTAQNEGSARPSARARPVGPAASISLLERVNAAVRRGASANTARLVVAPTNVQPSAAGVKNVYALTVSDCPMYFAEGLLVSNCDADQYASLHADADQGGMLQTNRAARPVQKVNAGGWT